MRLKDWSEAKTDVEKGRLERQVQTGVLAYLSIRKDIIFWRQNVGAVKFDDFFVRFGLRGAADIQGIQGPTGRFFGIECKREIGGKVSQEQENWGQNVENAGGLYIVARSVEAVEKALGPEQVRVVKLATRKRIYPR